MGVNRRLILIGGIVLAYLLFDLTVPHLTVYLVQRFTESSYWTSRFGVAMVAGICLGQVVLLAVGAMLPMNQLTKQIPISFALTGLVCLALVLGNRLFHRLFPAGQFIKAEDAFVFSGLVALSVLTLQLPLWVARRRGWRIIPPGFTETHLEPRTNTALKLVIALASIAIVYMLVLEAIPAQWFRPQLVAKRIEMTFKVLPLPILLNFLLVIPCIWGAFGKPRSWRLWIPAWSLMIVIISAIVLRFTSLPPGIRPYLLVFAGFAFQGLTIFGTLLLLRWFGYRLIRIA